MERALGVQWCIERDSILFRIVLKDCLYTRREILSVVSSIYDPLGFVAPLLLEGKKILQEPCRETADWDNPESRITFIGGIIYPLVQQAFELWSHC